MARGTGFAVGGMAKGSGMIHPNLATMLAVVTTDYPLEPGEAIEFLRPAVDTSFNAISVDGECSTNDTVLLLANGASGVVRTPETDAEFADCIRTVCGELAKQIVADGEGATVLAEIAVRGALNAPEARAIAERVATSPLVKTALHGHDANWGRIAAAAGSAKFDGGYAHLDPDKLSIAIDGVPVLVSRLPVGRRAGADERPLRDRDRPRARRRRRDVPDLRPLVRLRAHQRGLPLVSLVVLKVGGASAGGAADAVARLRAGGDSVCVVHGAGPQISEEMKRRGLEVQFVDGRRVTTPEGLEVVRDSFAAVNEELCRAIGADAVSLAGDEIGLQATHVPELGLVGQPLPTAPPEVLRALASGLVPVVSPLAEGPLNVNADEAASALAVGIGADQIVFLTDVAGVFHDGRLVRSISAESAETLVDSGHFDGGIVPKLLAASHAARNGLVAEIGVTAVVA